MVLRLQYKLIAILNSIFAQMVKLAFDLVKRFVYGLIIDLLYIIYRMKKCKKIT